MTNEGAQETKAEALPAPAGDEPIRFVLVRKERKVVLQGADGAEVHYVLKEMTGILRDRWMNALSKKVNVSTGKVTDFTGQMASLIGSCLFDARGVPVPERDIQEFPASVQEALFKLCQEMNGLDKKSADEEKND